MIIIKNIYSHVIKLKNPFMILISITKKSGDINDKLLNKYNIDKIGFINYAELQFFII